MANIYKQTKAGLYVPEQSVPKAKGYSEAGASHIKKALKGFIAQSGSAREDIDWNNRTLRQRGRILPMSSPVAASAIKTNRTNVVGVGLKLKSSIDREVLGLSPEAAKQWQWQVEREWELWASKKQNCDATGVNNFYGLQQLALQSWLSSGDVLAVLQQKDVSPHAPYGLRLQMVEADRVSTPNMVGVQALPGITDGKAENGNRIFDGVEVDQSGAVVAYHICSTYPYEITTEKQVWTRVEAYGDKTGLPNILHVMSAERPGQYRGVTYLAPVIEQLLQLRRYTESELMAALVQSFFTAWIQTTTNPAELPINEVGSEQREVSRHENEYEMGPATVFHLAENETVEFGKPTAPTTSFGNFVDALCKQIGAGLGLPAEVLLKQFNSNYSASRAAIIEAWNEFKMYRRWFVDDFCAPTYEVWLAEAVARGRIHAPGFWSDPVIRAAWCGARWIGPAQSTLDPKKEVEAYILQINEGLKTHEQVTTEMDGGDWEENVEQLARENALLKAAGGGKDTIYVETEKEEDEEQEGEKDT